MTRDSGRAFNASGHREVPRRTAGSGRRRVEVGEQGWPGGCQWHGSGGCLSDFTSSSTSLSFAGWLIGVFRIRVRSFCSGFSRSFNLPGAVPGFARECNRKQAPDPGAAGGN